MTLRRGSVVLVELDPAAGHEQRGIRPCVVISAEEVASSQKFPLLCVVPLTGTRGEGLLYPSIEPGPSGLVKQSFALIDQLRSIDKRRVKQIYGEVKPEELRVIEVGL
ncbi:MAG: type II toxin-antitoxin system PemK/MazF family toxin [Bryobacteraceae bacterium]|nr:type II toxin-antitoxin system PemK/MazF family toxin [Bryobacteraceae bacterium]